MDEQDRDRATRLLVLARQGDVHAASELTPLVYRDLRAIAAAYLRREQVGHTLEPTALVHEAYLRMVGMESLEVMDQLHFRAIAAMAMRRILVEHARARATRKRDGDRVSLDVSAAVAPAANLDILDLEDALARLAELDERQARVVELRFYSGLSVEEVSLVLGRSKRAVELDWTLARAFLRREMGRASR